MTSELAFIVTSRPRRKRLKALRPVASDDVMISFSLMPSALCAVFMDISERREEPSPTMRAISPATRSTVPARTSVPVWL